MAVPKVLLYYAFTPIADPDAIRLWQRDLCESLNLRGRILISKHGINGTVGGDLNNVKMYLRKTKEYPGFKKMDAKWSDGTGLDENGLSLDFPKLSVKARPEIVAFGVPDEIEVNSRGIVGGGKKLKPHELDALVAERGDEVLFFDGRNAWEAEIGRFKNAIVPDVKTTHDFVRELESGKYDHIKDKPIVTYCTGGIRCEILTPIMKARGFKEIYQIDGGIVRYGEARGNQGLWEGSLYVFDKRITMDFAPDVKLLGTCVSCGTKSNHMVNCVDKSCREQMVVCEECAEKPVYCDEHANVKA
ncbi:rhodanese-related sulfurtransferase [Aurantimicrobium sp. MWH-Uga1]|uniref:oxygen-dependent tRNA uridine(34) hydroxylase TrhO n=1 Tax=Aurantimicrobium sp. MWH-Uga1 TaxID=2079575 RepID=UPI000DED6823|nr:rhodanese-related sulfurtransferase [Aurantimicrobium sp. MWH-Uga1]AXE53759.1 putative rhodanese-related sulfurtransferase [Aurantimicrobium sp. MWH-Uga1]